jgi:hypothetical protein
MKRLTARALPAHPSPVAAHQRCEIGVSEYSRRTRTATSAVFFHVRGMAHPVQWAGRAGSLRARRSYYRYANPHGLPSPIGVGEGGNTTA